MKHRNVIVSFAATLVLAACATVPPESRQLAANYNAMQPTSGLSKEMTMERAERIRDGLVAELAASHGRVVGYKAGLTNPAVQKRFGVSSPVRGVLLEKMLIEDGAEVPAKFGAIPFFEADIVVVVKDEGINQAKTPADVIKHVSAIRPFIELPDLVTAKEQPLTGAIITSFNVGARLGVLGRPIAAAPEMADALGRMTVVMRDGDGKELGKAPGAAILGHPLNAVLWLAQDLAKSGGKLRAGDVLSLGSFTAPNFAKPGTAVTVTYEGLPGNPSVSVRFK
ncbi:MAG: 2-oxo-hept-4-ene-1,7-dioate hydratase [Rhodocyclaceae bacterium]|nr:MAG: hydratase [Rhodocyclaceae bacterium]MBV6406959.1 2-oxo-hept-4-ene-1,7-dioate hydratase [Rhodocyclaceae bacterium]CAG0945528.1 2-oxo-hept-3-ene-1,7-dioate hydratase [Gammaproteobacteria bacterium]